MNPSQMAYAQPVNQGKPKVSGRELADRNVAALACFLLHMGMLAGCAKVGALRLPDLVVTAIVLAVSYAMALRDNPKLPAFQIGIWIFAPLLRRLIDWRSGGFVSLTAVSVLPIMATLTLAIPTYPRWKNLKRGVREPWMYMVMPVLFATALGVALHGVAAGPAALKWLAPLLFVPYFAARPNQAESLRLVTRSLVVCAGISAVYAVYQFLFLPAWDKMWLIESGMTSSMGKPYPMQMRAWGTMNSCGPAAQVWCLSIIAGLLDTKWKSTWKKAWLVMALTAMLLSLVRSAWLMLCIGVVVMAIQSGGRRAGTAIFAGLLVFATILCAPMLPGGDRITRRLETFGDLGRDRSFTARNSMANDLADQLLENPLGRGMGFATASRVARTAAKTESIDNGFGELALTISVPGAALCCFGAYSIGRVASRYSKTRKGISSEQARCAVTALAMSGAAMVAGFTFAGLVGAVTWCLVGIGLSRQQEAKPQQLPAFPHAVAQPL